MNRDGCFWKFCNTYWTKTQPCQAYLLWTHCSLCHLSLCHYLWVIKRNIPSNLHLQRKNLFKKFSQTQPSHLSEKREGSWDFGVFLQLIFFFLMQLRTWTTNKSNFVAVMSNCSSKNYGGWVATIIWQDGGWVVISNLGYNPFTSVNNTKLENRSTGKSSGYTDISYPSTHRLTFAVHGLQG